jgi:hypothetical protein
MDAGQTCSTEIEDQLTMRRYVLLLSAFCLASLLVSDNAGTSAAEPLLPGYVLKQRHEIVGNTVTTICKDRVKVLVQKTGETFVSTAPLWRVSLYSLKSRRIYSRDFDKFNNPFSKALFVMGGTFMHTIPIMFSRTAIDNGMKITCYKAAPGFAETQMRRLKDLEIKDSNAKSIEYAVLSDPKIPQDIHIAKTLSKLFGLPLGSGIPLWLDYESCDKMHHTYFQRISLTKGTFGASEFTIPPGLTPTAHAEQVIAGEEADDSMKLIMMGSEREDKDKHQQKKR